ncbi:hypothetical protein ACFHW1_05125 [Micromonospora sp. LOL_014]|uniref:hypothetical protein n=1 Tax=Micromonospora sp. LOL_014 TaxID=3345415 RepID=UPI003A85DE2A
MPLPPRKCPLCLVGACQSCTGRLVVQTVAGDRRDVPCEHHHQAGTGPAARVIADIPIQIGAS